MKLTVLVDNNTTIDRYFLGEPALSFLIEDGEERVLFDAGYSDAFVQNAAKLGVDLTRITQIVLSHGHDDHTRGLPALFAIGMPYSAEALAERVDLRLVRTPQRISEHLIFLGEIPRTLDFEASYAMGERLRDGIWEPDLISEDSALVYESTDGLFIITGCSHSGICNIIEYAKRVCGESRILGVIGGFHLFADDKRLAQTVDHLAAQNMTHAYPCHCVSLVAKAKMLSAGLPVEEVGVGMTIEIA